MAGSLNHIIAEDATFTMDLIDGLGDAQEALEECFTLILELSKGRMVDVSMACRNHGFVDPYNPARHSSNPMPGAMKVPN